MVILFSFISAGCSPNFNIGAEKAVNIIKSYFEELDNRNFDVSYPIIVDNHSCYKIAVTGKLDSEKTYPIDTFAVCLINDTKYFYNPNTNQFEIFYMTPSFACQTSPDGKMRIESVGMQVHGDGPSGLYALREMRIINMQTGDVLWTDDSHLNNKFSWSENSRYVAAECSGRQWSQSSIIDTVGFTVVVMPNIDEIRRIKPEAAEPNLFVAMPLIRIVKWINPSVLLVHFEWMTNNSTLVTGEYEYDMISKTAKILNIDEINYG